MKLQKETRLETIREFYYGEECSVREVAERMGISPNTVRRIMDQNSLGRRNNSEQNKVRFDKKEVSFILRQALTLEEEKLKIAGIMLYWAEGHQSVRANSVDFANSKPNMIRVFLLFLRTICGVDEAKLRVYLYAYSNQDISEIITFWSLLTKIPEGQFTKPYIRKDFKLEKSGKMPYGLIHVRYGDKKLLTLIRNWIEEYSNCVGTQVVNEGAL